MTNKHWWLKGLSVSLVLVMVGIVSWFYWQPERLIRPSQTTTVAQVLRSERKNCFSGTLQIVNINTQKAATKRYLMQFKVTQTPTIIRYDHGQVTRYQGMNLTKIKHLLTAN